MKASSRCRAAFTLIELLTVMAIILILAGLIIHVAGSAQYNSAKARATSEIKAMETALESYKVDNGTYPLDPNTPSNSTDLTGLLNPQTDFEPTNAKYITNSEYLYQVLTGYPVSVGTNPSTSTAMSKTYISFTPSQLKSVSGTDTASNTNSKMYIIDPFGFSYGYSTINAQLTAQQQQASSTSTPTSITKYGYNPTFDLWSTAGYSTSGGRTTPSTTTGGGDAAVYSGLWVKNW